MSIKSLIRYNLDGERDHLTFSVGCSGIYVSCGFIDEIHGRIVQYITFSLTVHNRHWYVDLHMEFKMFLYQGGAAYDISYISVTSLKCCGS